MKCIAIDDEPLALNVIEMFCKKIPGVELCAVFSDGVDALQYIRTEKPDLVFLDINMPQMSGVEIAKLLEKDILIVFTTAYQDFAVEGFELEALDYLLKPFSFQRFFKAVSRAEKQLELKERQKETPGEPEEKIASDNTFIMIRSDYATVRVEIRSIICVEGLKDYVKIYTQDKNYVTKLTMKTIEAALVPHGFMRVHKSHLVNLDMVHSFENNHISLPKNIKISVGSSFRNEFVEYLEKNKI